MAQEGLKRKLAAILSADVAGYSRLMEEDEATTVQTLTAYRNTITSLIQQHRGRVVDSPGDNLLAEFISVVDAVQCAVETQELLKAKNSELPEDRRMQFRIGINLGDVIEEGNRIYGDGVNIASRIEAMADPGGICISMSVYNQIKKKLVLDYEDLGEHSVKNISEPIRVYRVPLERKAAPVKIAAAKKLKLKRWHWATLAAAMVLISVAAALMIQYYVLRPAPIEPASVDKLDYPLPDKPSIAVLPFVNLSGDPEQEYFADAISENIITELSRFDHLFVIARQSAFAYKGSTKKTNQISQELGVRYLLEGSVQKSDDQVRIIAQLIDAISGEHVWTGKFDRNLSNIFAIQDEITLTVVNTLSEKIWQVSAKGLSKKPSSNFKAWDYILRGRMHFRRYGKQENETARALFEKALELDPDLSQAYISVAWTHYMDWRFWGSESEAIDKVEVWTNKAAALGENKAEIQFLLSRIALGRGRYDAAFAHMERALELSPNDTDLIYNYGTLLVYAGRSEESIPWFKKAMRLNPFHPDEWVSFLAAGYYYTHRYREVVDTMAPKGRLLISDHALLSASYAQLGHIDEARAHVNEILKIDPEFTLSKFRRYSQKVYKNENDIEHIIDGLRKAGLTESPPLSLPDKPSIAVLPFVNMSGNPEQEYFVDGITENIIMALSKTPKLFVIARNSTFVYKDKPTNIKQVAKELGVRYILEGSVQKTENRIRVTAQLIDATTAMHLWAERYDRELKDIFALQDEITLEIITALQVELTEGEQSRIHRGGTTHLEAFLKVLKGREHQFRYTPEDMEIAKRMYRESIDLDPKYAMAYSHLAGAIITELNSGWSKSRKKNIELLFELSEKIFSLDSSSAQAHTILSGYYRFTGQLDKAITEAEKAIDLDPNDADGYANGGYVLFRARRYKEAISWFKKAIHRNPRPPIWYLGELCLAYMGNNQHNEAVDVGKKLIKNYPDRHAAYWYLGASYFGMGSYEEAIATFKKGIERAPTNTWYLELCAMAQSMAGRHKEAIRMVKNAINYSNQESQYNQVRRLSTLAEYYRRAGLYEEAIDTSRKLLDYNPDNKQALRAYITLTCAYSALGRKENAHEAAAEVMRINPNFSMEAVAIEDSWAGTSHYDWFLKHEPDKNLLLNALRKAELK